MLAVLSLAVSGCAPSAGDPDHLTFASVSRPTDFEGAIGDRVFFATNRSTLTHEARVSLDRQAGWLHGHIAYALMVAGHADERGTRAHNIALGARRAAAVRAYLIARNIAPGRIRVGSLGPDVPAATCRQEFCWAQNRRAELLLRPAS